MDTCPVCESKDVARKEITETIRYEELSLEIPNFVVDACGKCGEYFPIPESIRRASEAARMLHAEYASQANNSSTATNNQQQH